MVAWWLYGGMHGGVAAVMRYGGMIMVVWW